VNPYFIALFDDRMKLHPSHCEIRLVCGQRDITTPRRSRSMALLEAIDTMHVTQPPCKAFSLYMKDQRSRFNLFRVGHIRNTNGARVKELVAGLEDCSEEVVRA
jgi:hypothetical protein